MKTAQYAEGFQTVPISALVPSKTNPRKTFDKERQAQLTASITSKGILQPILVRPLLDKLEIVAGERRFRGATAAKLEEVPVSVKNLTDQEALEVQVIENLQREDVHFLEEALGFHQLVKHGPLTVEALALKVGKTPQYIATRMRLVSLSQKWQKACFEGELPLGMAIELCRIQPKDQDSMPKFIDDLQALRNWISREILLDLHAAAFKKDDEKLVPAAGACTTCPKRTGNAPLLFPDVKKTDTCTDPRCFNAKIEAHVQAQVTANKELVQVTMDYNKKAKKGLVYVDQYSSDAARIVKADDPGATRGVVVDGREAGKLVFVSTLRPKREANVYQQQQQRDVANKHKFDRKVTEAVAAAIIAKVDTEQLGSKDWAEIYEAAIKSWLERLTCEQEIALNQLMQWNLPKSQYSRSPGDAALKRKVREALNAGGRERAKLWVAMTISFDVGFVHKADIVAAAKKWGVNAAAIEKEIREAKKKGKGKKAVADAKPKGKGKKQK